MKKLIIALLTGFAGMAFCAARPNIIVVFTDDHGYADLGALKIREDVKTPNIDAMAGDGVICSSGYVTAPQCAPSRAGLMSGRYQQKFNFDHNLEGPLPLSEVTIAERLKKVGYKTGMVGKWHLEVHAASLRWAIENKVPTFVSKRGRKLAKINFEMMEKFFPQHQGFDEFYKGEHDSYWANYGMDGKNLKPDGQWVKPGGYRLDIQSDAALAFIERNKKDPFFLYLGYYAPHTPLEATEKYLSRFPSDMPVRRRYCLAMISAMDDGIGKIRELLRKEGLLDNTLIFLIGDNGAPLKLTMEDAPIAQRNAPWDGSRNDPWTGEKGTLLEGGIRVPYVVSWPAVLPKGKVYKEPVISLDVAATVMASVGEPVPEILDGENIIPRLTGEKTEERTLCWRFWGQTAIRRGKWKYVKLSDGREWLFDLESAEHEKKNRLAAYPEKTQELKRALQDWSDTLIPKGLPQAPLNVQEVMWYDYYMK